MLEEIIALIHNENCIATMSRLSSASVDLIITSPPYNVGIDYENYNDNLTKEDYENFLLEAYSEMHRILTPGGRLCINVANTGRKPYIANNALTTKIMLDLNFLMRGEIIWDKTSRIISSTSWGSWMSASNPTLRDAHEYILVYSKDRYNRDKEDRESTITKEEFMKYTNSIWQVLPTTIKKSGHPAAFPKEIPYRLIQLYSFKGDTIYDPFMGSGTTGIAALDTDRKFIGSEISLKYFNMAKAKMEQTRL